MFGLTLDDWNNVLVASFAIAAAAAIVGGVATWWVIRLTKEESASLQVALSGANERIEALKTQGDEARAQIALANKAAAEAGQKAEQERLARVKLEAQLAPRVITESGTALLTKEVASLKGTQVDIVAYESMGADVPALAMQIEAALNHAGLDAAVFTPLGGAGIVRGILVRTEVGSGDFLTTGVATLVKALTDAGLAADSWPAYPVGETIAGAYNAPTGRSASAKIRILIGSKPSA